MDMRDFLNTFDRQPYGFRKVLSSILMFTMIIILVYVLESFSA